MENSGKNRQQIKKKAHGTQSLDGSPRKTCPESKNCNFPSQKKTMAHVSYVFLFRFFVSGNCNFWISDMSPAKPIQALGSICFFAFFISLTYGDMGVLSFRIQVPNFQWLRPGSQGNLPGYQSLQRETAERSPPCSGGLKGWVQWKNPWKTQGGTFLHNGG